MNRLSPHFHTSVNTLGINTEDDEELTDIQALEDLTDNIKQNLIHEYKNRYSRD